MTERILANGTFDLLHPGHLHYLEESAALGEELIVVIARDSRAREKKNTLLFDEQQRRDLVAALEPVDRAILGSNDSIFDTVKKVDPSIITLGYDQDFEKASLEDALDDRGFDTEVIRISEGPTFSSSQLKDRL
ncbi:MAG: adenylyltransferase/cytidyltransferase family protein [Candidatus Nanohaloarchaeota archaeon QJJ-5]|nr:adenylyltransferase/cytidyltransferase family protein [Candidatus Nanohaloarchaeota archaeon QJJ-5]